MNALVPRRWQPLVIGSTLLGITALIIINVGVAKDENGGIGPAIIGIVLLLLAAFLLWRFVVGPRVGDDGVAAAAGTAALILGVVSLLAGFVFWSGLVFAFAPAAIALGTASLPDAKGRAGQVLGLLGLALSIVLLISDQAS
jgi:hypothetical protein